MRMGCLSKRINCLKSLSLNWMKILPGQIMKRNSYITTKTACQLLSAILLAIFMTSCAEDSVLSDIPSEGFSVPATINKGESVQLTTDAVGKFDKIEWLISDGTSYLGSNAVHTFNRAGIYEIQLRLFQQNSIVSTNSSYIEVLSTGRILESDIPIAINDAFYYENKIVLSVHSLEEKSKSSFYILDKNLSLIKKVDDTDAIVQEFNTLFTLGDSVFALASQEGSGVALHQFKSTNNRVSPDPENTFIEYNNGFVYGTNQGNTGFYIEFYNALHEKLWSKNYQDDFFASSRYLFNLNNRLYYLSFDKHSDKATVEKFKNPSVVFTRNSMSFNIEASNREELFAYSNAISNTIILALYCNQSNQTTVYEINEACKLRKLRTFNDKLVATPEFCMSNGMMVLKSKNKLLKFDTEWSLMAEKEMSNSDFGICQVGENMLLLYEIILMGVFSYLIQTSTFSKSL
jgi:PKD repeat protein